MMVAAAQTSPRFNAVFLDLDSVDNGDLDLGPLQNAVTSLTCFPSTSATAVTERCQKADIVITNKVVLDDETLRNCPDLKLICAIATGVNQIDLDAARQLNVPACNIRDYATESVTQHVFALILELARNTRRYHDACINGEWSRSNQFCLLDFPIDDLTDKTLGIVGYGVLGQSVATMARAFGMRVLVAERQGATPRDGRQALEQVLENSDIISLHCPLTADTEHLINEQTLSSMKSNAWLVNTARGGLVDQTALIKALDKGIIAAAALDVVAQEPPELDDPLFKQQRDNLIITPHIAWASRKARQNAIQEVALNIDSFNQGIMRNQVG